MTLENETQFRFGFAVFWLVNFIIRFYFQSRARRSERMYVMNHRGAVLGFRILAIAYLLLLGYSFSTWYDFGHLQISALIRWTVGLGLLISYLALFTWSHVVLGGHWSGLLEIHRDHALITGGPYRFIRHPMYSAFFLSCVGVLVFTSNWFLFALYGAAVAFMYFTRVSAEERMMLDQFGESYRKYMGETGRLFVPLRKPKSRA